METISKTPTVAYSESQLTALIIDIEMRKDKNGQDYWRIYTQIDANNKPIYLAFSQDYNLSTQARSLLTNYPHRLVNSQVLLTLRKKAELTKVINLAIVQIEDKK